MKMSSAEQESLIALLTRIYKDIYDIEEEYQLLAGDHDFRPRIEYFHDAVRAFSAGNPKEREAGGRLSIELLAYDLSCLRYIHSMPLSPFKPHGEVLSPSTEMVKVKDGGLTVKPKRPDRVVRERISDLYQHYAVLFAALLKPFADRDFLDRVGDLNQDVQDVSSLIQQFEKLHDGKGSTMAVMEAINHLEEEELREALQAFMQQQQFKKKDNLVKMNAFLKAHAERKDKAIAAIEAAHMNYVLAQLGIFEGSKDMVKKMAAQGMNLVGKFVEASIAEARREMGR